MKPTREELVKALREHQALMVVADDILGGLHIGINVRKDAKFIANIRDVLSGDVITATRGLLEREDHD